MFLMINLIPPGSPSDAVVLRGKKRTSDVWDHFDEIMVGDVRKARCKACKKDLSYKEGSGVSHLRKHFLKSCPMKYLGNIRGQKKLRTILEDDGTTTLELKEKYKEFDQDFSRSKLVTMVVIHEYPLSMADHFGFREYSKSLNPSFKLISRNTLRGDIFKMYNADKLSLKRLLEYNDSRIAVTNGYVDRLQSKERLYGCHLTFHRPKLELEKPNIKVKRRAVVLLLLSMRIPILKEKQLIWMLMILLMKT